MLKQLSVHSEDRDIKKWPCSNQFEVELPVDYKNVSSMELNDVEIPATFYVFSATNQNTRLAFEIAGTAYVAEITSGTYKPPQLALELAGQMTAVGPSTFAVVYDQVSHKFVFSTAGPFTLDFTTSLFDGTFYENYGMWGLGYNLGFQKKRYDSVGSTVQLYWEAITLTGDNVTSPNTVDLYGDSHVYMEVFLFNSMDEIRPYTERSNNLYGAKQNGKHNSAFAKIPICGRHAHDGDGVGHSFYNRYGFNTNVFRSEPPLERIQKLKFKFRFHDGRPVDFGTQEFSFTIQFKLARADLPPFSKE